MSTPPLHVVRAGVDPWTPGDRAAAGTVVAAVGDGAIAALDGPDRAGAARVLAVLRRADLLAATSAAVADALADRLPVAPWDVLVAPALAAAAPAGPAVAGPAVAGALDRLARRPPRPRRLAFVTPLPPDATGVARYSHALACALGRRAEVVVVATGEPAPDRRPPGTALVDVATFEAEAACGAFDEIVYALGNHPRHGTELALLRRWPGAVQLHDVRLVGAYAGLHAPGDALADELQRLYPGRYDRSVLREAELTMEPSARAGVWLVREVAALATTVLVHSRHAASLVTDDCGVEPVVIGPLAAPAAVARRDPADDDERLVVTCGAVDGSKRPEALVDALAELPGDVWLAIVGPVSEADRAALRRRAVERGVDGRVVLTGRVPDDELDAWLRRAAVAVQRRGRSNGESSAAVADCLAHGLPTVVDDAGAAAELARSAVVHLAPDAGASELAGVLRRLLDDTAERRRLGREAHALAAAEGFDAAAGRLLDALFGPGR